MNESDPRSNVHYLGGSESKAWKKYLSSCIISWYILYVFSVWYLKNYQIYL